MRCGEKRFLVTYEIQDVREVVTLLARTPAEARKKFRADSEAGVKIVSVIQEK